MRHDAVIAGRAAGFQITRPIELTCFALCVAQAVFLVAMFVQGSWIFNSAGQLLATDFVNVWAAGHHVLEGNPTVAYDVGLHKDAQVSALGHAFEGEYPWIYPPTFLFPAAALATAPYLSAYAIWIILTFTAYAAVIRGIIGRDVGIFLACAYPGILSNLIVGQNGFLTAALIGGALLAMPQRPLLSGCLLGLLTFKPHLGVLVPVVLIASGRWTVIGAATVTTATLSVASWLAFGNAPWEAFFQAVQAASQATLADGRADWSKLQSLYGIVRMFGGSEGLAFALQGSLMAATAAILFAIWRSQVSFDIKSAALVTGMLLATPYIYLYDLVALAVPMAFLLRAGADRGVPRGEIAGLGAACLMILIFPIAMAPVGLAAVCTVALIIARRILTHDRRQPPDEAAAIRT